MTVSAPGPSGMALIRRTESFLHALFEPLLRNVYIAALRFPFRERRHPKVTDETLAKFLIRVSKSEQLANDLASAMVHGIYAGDIDKLSAKALLGRFWHFEATGKFKYVANKNKQEYHMSNYEHWLLTYLRQLCHTETLLECRRRFADKVYSFKGGMSTLTDALQSTLSLTSNVEIITEANISRIRTKNSNGKMVVCKTFSICPYVIFSSFHPHTSKLSGSRRFNLTTTGDRRSIMLFLRHLPKLLLINCQPASATP